MAEVVVLAGKTRLDGRSGGCAAVKASSSFQSWRCNDGVCGGFARAQARLLLNELLDPAGVDCGATETPPPGSRPETRPNSQLAAGNKPGVAGERASEGWLQWLAMDRDDCCSGHVPPGTRCPGGTWKYSQSTSMHCRFELAVCPSPTPVLARHVSTRTESLPKGSEIRGSACRWFGPRCLRPCIEVSSWHDDGSSDALVAPKTQVRSTSYHVRVPSPMPADLGLLFLQQPSDN
jgi:hypothetical protein